MTDYQANSARSRGAEPKKVKPKIESVVVETVTIRKKTLGEKFKALFLGADLKNVARYVGAEVLIPAARNMVVDAMEKGSRRMVYGDSTYPRHRPSYPARSSYQTPVNRGFPMAQPRPYAYDRPVVQVNQEEFIIASRGDAERVLDTMQDIIAQYEVASISDLKELVGFEPLPIDNKWGWESLRGTQIRQTREGFMLDLPPAIEI